MSAPQSFTIITLGHTYRNIRDDLGDLGDLPKELATTVANVYHGFFLLAENPTASMAPVFEATDGRSAIKSYGKSMETMAIIQSSFEFAKELIKTVRESRKQNPELFDYLVVLTLDILKYYIESADSKTPLRRAIERKFKKVDEIPNLLDILATRGMVVFSPNRQRQPLT